MWQHFNSCTVLWNDSITPQAKKPKVSLAVTTCCCNMARIYLLAACGQ